MLTSDPVEATLRRVEAQEALFAAKVYRLAVQSLKLPDQGVRRCSVNVWRNHAIEPVAALARPYMLFGRWLGEFSIGDYDDSLAFHGHAKADVELLWLDSQRYLASMDFGDWLEWLRGRLFALRALTKSPIVLATWVPDDRGHVVAMQAMTDGIPGAYFADLGAVCAAADVRLLDQRTAAVAGTLLSNAAQPVIARKLACHWLAAVVLPPIKALALDLDHTLHKGVLGEDGVDGVELTEVHRKFQEYAKSLRERGIFLSLVSKNDRADVEKLFASRSDFELQWSDFSATEVGWTEKAAAIARIAESLRISSDAVLFIDDNPGELAQVAARLPDVHAVCAASDASLTQRVVEHYPGLWRWRVEADDAKRVRDLQANAEREALLHDAADPAEYFHSLQVSLT
ncbi:HAD-IIIC family phosphatase, partial [Oxalobacteraceae bacterium OM1]